MTTIEQLITEAVAAQEIPGAVLAATNRDGSFNYGKAFGNSSMDPERAKPLQLDSPMWSASCTKLMTCICAMQLVERGLVNLDDPVTQHLPELDALPVIKSLDADGKATFDAQDKKITLRMLLSHTSGLEYDLWSPTLSKYLEYMKLPQSHGGKVLDKFSNPLVFQPGSSFVYSPSIDYAGLLVERISGLTLEEYMKKNIWGPLGVKNITFYLSQRPDLEARLVEGSIRTETGKAVPFPMKVYQHEGKELEDCLGGMGIFTTAEDYLKILKAVLVDSTEGAGKLLKQATWDEFFKPQLSEAQIKAENEALKVDVFHNILGAPGKEIELNWGLGGTLMMQDSAAGPKAGTMRWAGAPGLYWFIDRKAGLCGCYFGQVFMPGDAKPAELNHEWEKDVYRMYAERQGKL